eukprot:4216170-Prymnesium_polylepis.1
MGRARCRRRNAGRQECACESSGSYESGLGVVASRRAHLAMHTDAGGHSSRRFNLEQLWDVRGD